MNNEQRKKVNRRSLRLPDYDYSQVGAYYVTICTNGMACLFGAMVDGEVLLNEAGQNVKKCWERIPEHYPEIHLDEFIIMPNHLHGILFLSTSVGVQNSEPLQRRNRYQKIIPRSLGSIVRGFKIGVTKWFRGNTLIRDPWQRNFFENVIRNDADLSRIRQYISENPIRWQTRCKDPSAPYLRIRRGSEF